MPTAKGKGGSTSHRYRPASEYDDATLAQKREYWRTKKREQRARLSDRRRSPAQDSREKKLLLPNSPTVLNSVFSGSFRPLDRSDASPASQSGNTVGCSSFEATENQKERWLETINLNKVLPTLPASCSISAPATEGDAAAMKYLRVTGPVSKAVTSPTPSGTQLNTSNSVPPVRVTTIINGSSTETTPPPWVSMQGVSAPETQHTTQSEFQIQPNLLPTNVTTGIILASSPCDPDAILKKGKAANATPQSRTKSALVSPQRAKGVTNPQPSSESEEERAAKRREQWRIKKREQRAKVAAQVAKTRERIQGGEMTLPRPPVQKTRLVGNMILPHLPSPSFLRGIGQKHCASRVRTSFASARRENNKLKSGGVSLATVNLQTAQIKIQNPHGNRTSQTAVTSEGVSVRRMGERRFPGYLHLSNVSRGFARCKTPRQRFIDAQKLFMSQRHIRCKSPLLMSVFGSRNIPRIDPNDTPEQIISKRREYWRIKKREQRAKLSMEVKSRLKEKDSLMRRVKRYHNILEEMRRARALSQAAGSTLTDASETIGGFIKEDGTVIANIPQVPTDHDASAHKSEELLPIVSPDDPVTEPLHQTDVLSAPIPTHQPPLQPPQVKVSPPLPGQFVHTSPRQFSFKPRTPESTTPPNSPSLALQTAGQLTLTHPQNQSVVAGGAAAAAAAGSKGGCVMKMAVSNSLPSALCLDPNLTEEERMAKKREYWRIKKREQRAVCAARLKQGVLQARVNAALQRRAAQKQAAATLGRRLMSPAGNVQCPPTNSVPITPHPSEIKQEYESQPAGDLHPQPEQPICPAMKPATSPTPPPAPQPEPDPALSADSQATTLLAVASMKKLLEESLSTVTECQSEQADIKTELAEEASPPETKPNLPELFFEKDGVEDEVGPVSADLELEIKNWQPDADALVQECVLQMTSPELKDASQISNTLSTSSEETLHPYCEHSTQTPSNFILNPTGSPDGPSSPRITQRLCPRKASQPNSCSPEPAKLHHLPMDQPPPQQQPPQLHCDQPCEAQEQSQDSNSPSPPRLCGLALENSGLTSLQRKREYWKLMKRQQRARLKARLTGRYGECSSSGLSQENLQAPGLGMNDFKDGSSPAKPPAIRETVAASIPTVLVLSSTASNAGQSPDTLQVKLPVTSVSCSPRSEQNDINMELLQMESDYLEETQQQAMLGVQDWLSRSSDEDLAPCLPTLTPPDNPLSSIDLQPIEPSEPPPDSDLSPVKLSSSPLPSPSHAIDHPSPSKLAPVSTMVPPKPIPGESEEDFLRRKREYWRIKKKEQRARKAIRDKGTIPKAATTSWRPIPPAEDVQTQDSGQWVSSSEESEQLLSSSLDTDLESFPYSSYAPAEEDESETLFTDFESNNVEEGPVSDTVWRNRYLMDYDPLNQLLVCMVCGELQYSHSLEGVRAHIDEAHPDTLTMDPTEKQGMLEAWDEQVSQRERFFTSQLQQHGGGALAEAQDRDN